MLQFQEKHIFDALQSETMILKIEVCNGRMKRPLEHWCKQTVCAKTNARPPEKKEEAIADSSWNGHKRWVTTGMP